MKIWLQSGSALTADTGTPYGRLYEQSLERHMKTVARVGTELETFGIESTPYGKDRYRVSFNIVVSQMIKSVLQAEPKGFDAVAVINTFDHGYYEMRELLDIPVVFITESAMHLACQLASTFSFVTHNEALLLQIAAMAKRYGVAERMVPGAHLGLTYEDFPNMHAQPEDYICRFTMAARQAIAQGATMLMVAGNPLNMFLIDQQIRDIDGVPILDCCTAAVKTAELLVDLRDLGIERSTKGLFETPPPDAKAKIRTLFED